MPLHLRVYITENIFFIVKEEGILFAKKIGSASGTKILARLASCNFNSFVVDLQEGLKIGSFQIQIDKYSSICYKKQETDFKLNFPNFKTSFSGNLIFDFVINLRDCISNSFLFHSEIILVGQLKAFSNYLATKFNVEQANLCIAELEAGLLNELEKFLQPSLDSKKDDVTKFIYFHSRQLRCLCTLDMILQNKE
jgi:hypothetical protein